MDVRQLYTNGQVTVTARRSGSSKPLCLGERIRVFWASYTSGADGVSHLYQSQSHYLDRDHPSWTMTIIVPAKCGSSWYIGRDNPAVPTTFAKGVVPFGSHKIYWDNDSYRC